MLEPARTPSPPPAPSPQDFAEPMDLSEKAGPTGPGVAGVAGVPGKGGPAPGGGSMRQNQVGTVILSGVPIVSLVIEAKERLCLAQISNTLLKQFSYNEIHNRRVALGITCVQCTPVQLEILRRAGAMPISSRRCGMITKREAERLVKSFLEEHTPPGLPENFAFNVRHTCGWGCKGSFVPARYNSSRAKCIRCTYCNMFYSPNKFIFHFHRTPDAKYRHPDAANFNSWRRHLHLDYPDAHEEMVHAWEDVKAMFNGGSRKRLMTPTKSPSQHHHSGEDGPSKKMRPDAMGEQMNMPKVGDAGMRFNMMPAVSSPMPALIGQGPGNPYGSFPAAAMMHPENLFNPAESQKLNMNNLWKGRANPYYHPLGLFWAKNLGIYPPSGAGPFPGNPGMQGDEVIARELMMRGKLPPRAVAPSLQHEEMMKEKDLPLPWKHMSAFRPVGGYSRGPTLSPSGLGFTSGAGGDDNSSERISNPAMSPENVMSDVEDVADEHEHEHEYEHGNEHGHEHEHVHVHENEQDHDINVTDVLETDVNKNDIDGKGMDGEGEGEDVSPKAVTPTLPVEPKDAAEDINQTSSIIRDDKGEMLEAADNSPDPQPSQVESRIPNTILSMSKEELQRELIKMMSGKTETKNIDSTEQIECV